MSISKTLLCVSNFPSNTGYAWDFIEGLYARISDALAAQGVRTLVAYPNLRGEPRSLHGSTATAVELDFGFSNLKQLRNTLRFIRQNRVKAIYLTDRAACSLYYPVLRLAGVSYILTHDHTSGERTSPRGLKRLMKLVYISLPGVAADMTVTVSDYVLQRDTRTASVRPSRALRVWNGIPLRPSTPPPGALQKLTRVGSNRMLIVCCCRAHPVKGIAHLFKAFDTACRLRAKKGDSPLLVYIGNGPQRKELEAIRESLESRDDIVFLGYREDASRLLDDADICVVPSVWQDAFPLGVLEPMAAGKPVVATSVGGVPEMIENEVTGLLVPPGDSEALAAAIRRLLDNPALRAKLGAAARARVADRFKPEGQLAALTGILGNAFADQR
jgi:glycosyltransferase involved in cell wall biosynthesis